MEAHRPVQEHSPPGGVRPGRPNRYLAAILILLAIGALKLTQSVTLPLAIALFFVAVFWPLQRRLEQRMRKGVAGVLTLLCFLAVAAVIVGALWFAGSMIAEQAPQYAEEFNRLKQNVQQQAQKVGISLPLGGSGAQGEAGGTGTSGGGVSPAQGLIRIGSHVFSFLAGFLLVIVLFLFGLFETDDFRAKLRTISGGRADHWISAAHEISSDFQRFVVVRGAVALTTGLLVFGFSLLVGLDFAYLWLLITFMLEFVPTVGTFLSFIPPMLFALFQFGSGTKLILVLAGLGLIQFIMGNFVEPLVEGKYLKLSPLVIIIAIAFWAWVWGAAGAFMALPITLFIAITCRHFERTRWVATLLSSHEDKKE